MGDYVELVLQMGAVEKKATQVSELPYLQLVELIWMGLQSTSCGSDGLNVEI